MNGDRRPGRELSARRRLGRRLVGVALLVAIGAGVGWALRDLDWSGARGMLNPRAVPYLVAAAALNLAALVCAMLAWRSSLVELGQPVARTSAARIYFAGVVAKYLPGRVWVLLTQAKLARDAGLSGTATVTAFFLNLVIVLLTGSAVGILAGPVLLDGRGWWLAGPVLLLGFLLARPAVVGRLAAAGARLLRRDLTPAGTGRGTRVAIGCQLACWLVSGLHVWFLTLAIGAPAGPSLPVSVTGFALATVLSTLVVVMPDGAVVREVLLVLALAPVLPLAAATAVALASRAVCLLTELLMAAGVFAGAGLTRWRTATAAVPPHR